MYWFLGPEAFSAVNIGIGDFGVGIDIGLFGAVNFSRAVFGTGTICPQTSNLSSCVQESFELQPWILEPLVL